MKITNPVLKGFNPDPSICRVGEDYYMAVSTFEWFPGFKFITRRISSTGDSPRVPCKKHLNSI